jgi:hypothetical protein
MILADFQYCDADGFMDRLRIEVRSWHLADINPNADASGNPHCLYEYTA